MQNLGQTDLALQAAHVVLAGMATQGLADKGLAGLHNLAAMEGMASSLEVASEAFLELTHKPTPNQLTGATGATAKTLMLLAAEAVVAMVTSLPHFQNTVAIGKDLCRRAKGLPILKL